MEIKDLIIFLLIFIIVMWLQNNDDKKFNKPKRESLYDMIKLPLFVSLIILIVKDLNCKIYDNFEALFIFEESPKINNLVNLEKFNNYTNKYDNGFNDIFIGPPDF
jgi:hypothetical protein